MKILFGYIDPGAGSLVVQAVIAGIVAIPVTFRSRIARAIGAFRGHSQRRAKTSTEQADADRRG